MSVRKDGKARSYRRRSPAEIARDRVIITEMYFAGKTQAEIGERVKRNQSTVSRDLRALHGQWLDRAGVTYGEAKARELAEIDNLERVYWAAWQASRKKREQSMTETTEGGGGERFKVQLREEERDGNPTFLGGIQWCIERRMAIFGLKVTKFAETDPSGQYPSAARDRDLAMTDAEKADEIMAILDRARGRADD